MKLLLDNTVLGALLAPVEVALQRSRANSQRFRSLSMSDFIALGVQRHLQGIKTGREQVQALAHEIGILDRPPLARSTWGNALASKHRTAVLVEVITELLARARRTQPDRLAGVPGLTKRAVFALDGSYQKESAHFGRCTRAEGGEDSAKGHCLLSFFDLRLGAIIDAHVDTRSRHEMPILKEYDKGEVALTRTPEALWLVDRAFIDASFWDQKKHKAGITVITRLREDLAIDSNEFMEVSGTACNKGVISDQHITLASSKEEWRLVIYRSTRGRTVRFLSNEFGLEPGELAFLYSRRWEEEKAFDVWKNDWAMAKAWGKSVHSITNQVNLAIITGLLLQVFLGGCGCDSGQDEKSLRKQAKRSAGEMGGTDRPAWTEKVYRYTTRISRQVLRFFKHAYRATMSEKLIESQLRPLLQYYL